MAGGDVDLWPLYDAIRCPTLVIRGADSDLLLHGSEANTSTRRLQSQRWSI